MLVLCLEAKALISVFVDEEMKRVVDVTDTTQSSKNDNQELVTGGGGYGKVSQREMPNSQMWKLNVDLGEMDITTGGRQGVWGNGIKNTVSRRSGLEFCAQ